MGAFLVCWFPSGTVGWSCFPIFSLFGGGYLLINNLNKKFFLGLCHYTRLLVLLSIFDLVGFCMYCVCLPWLLLCRSSSFCRRHGYRVEAVAVRSIWSPCFTVCVEEGAQELEGGGDGASPHVWPVKAGE